MFINTSLTPTVGTMEGFPLFLDDHHEIHYSYKLIKLFNNFVIRIDIVICYLYDLHETSPESMLPHILVVAQLPLACNVETTLGLVVS